MKVLSHDPLRSQALLHLSPLTLNLVVGNLDATSTCPLGHVGAWHRQDK